MNTLRPEYIARAKPYLERSGVFLLRLGDPELDCLGKETYLDLGSILRELLAISAWVRGFDQNPLVPRTVYVAGRSTVVKNRDSERAIDRTTQTHWEAEAEEVRRGKLVVVLGIDSKIHDLSSLYQRAHSPKPIINPRTRFGRYLGICNRAIAQRSELGLLIGRFTGEAVSLGVVLQRDVIVSEWLKAASIARYHPADRRDLLCGGEGESGASTFTSSSLDR